MYFDLSRKKFDKTFQMLYLSFTYKQIRYVTLRIIDVLRNSFEVLRHLFAIVIVCFSRKNCVLLSINCVLLSSSGLVWCVRDSMTLAFSARLALGTERRLHLGFVCH